MKQLGSHRTDFHENFLLEYSWKMLRKKKIQVSLQSDKNRNLLNEFVVDSTTSVQKMCQQRNASLWGTGSTPRMTFSSEHLWNKRLKPFRVNTESDMRSSLCEIWCQLWNLTWLQWFLVRDASVLEWDGVMLYFRTSGSWRLAVFWCLHLEGVHCDCLS